MPTANPRPQNRGALRDSDKADAPTIVWDIAQGSAHWSRVKLSREIDDIVQVVTQG